jgi:polysaccharide export outer membrane protein
MATGSVTLPPPDPASGAAQADYRIGPLDELDVVVFQDKDMSGTVDVDASGRIDLPLIGALTAAGKTPDLLAKEIADKLGEKYLQSPHVAVQVKKAASQKVIVDGQVGQPGVYPLTGRTTLLQAVALAKGADQYADLKHVTVFRFVGAQRYSQVFNLDLIRRAKAPDPEIFSNDVVVVERSGAKSAIRDFVSPLLPLAYILPRL